MVPARQTLRIRSTQLGDGLVHTMMFLCHLRRVVMGLRPARFAQSFWTNFFEGEVKLPAEEVARSGSKHTRCDSKTVSDCPPIILTNGTHRNGPCWNMFHTLT